MPSSTGVVTLTQFSWSNLVLEKAPVREPIMEVTRALFLLLATVILRTDGIVIKVDTSKAPDLQKFGRLIKKVLEKEYPRLRNFLYSPTFEDVPKASLTFDPHYKGVAYALGKSIVGSVEYYRGHLDDVGSMVHELAHVVQNYRDCPSWVTEGIADYYRYYIFEPRNSPRKPKSFESHTGSYGITAYFLNYVVRHVRNDMLYWVNKDCREGTYKDTIWNRLTGRDLATLWNEMQRRTRK